MTTQSTVKTLTADDFRVFVDSLQGFQDSAQAAGAPIGFSVLPEIFNEIISTKGWDYNKFLGKNHVRMVGQMSQALVDAMAHRAGAFFGLNSVTDSWQSHVYVDMTADGSLFANYKGLLGSWCIYKTQPDDLDYLKEKITDIMQKFA